jgi:putative sigma-54 modulation protein
MKFQYTFQKIPLSEFVIKAAENKIGHSCRYLLKAANGHVFFGKKGHNFTVKVSIQAGGEGYFKAMAEDENLYAAIDIVCDKLERQFLRKKDKLQKHKKFEFSREGKLLLLNESLEANYALFDKRLKKAM